MSPKSSEDKHGPGPRPRGEIPHSPSPGSWVAVGWACGAEPLPGPSGQWLDRGGPWQSLCNRLRTRAERSVGAEHPKPQREPHKVTPPFASHMAFWFRFPLKNDFRGLASSRPQLTLLFEKGEDDLLAPIETWQKNLRNRRLQK